MDGHNRGSSVEVYYNRSVRLKYAEAMQISKVVSVSEFQLTQEALHHHNSLEALLSNLSNPPSQSMSPLERSRN